jgi:hypothetical protein
VSIEHNLDALSRLRTEPGWAGAFTHEQAPGAIANGSRVVKILDEPSDAHRVGATATVLGSIGPIPDVVELGPFASAPAGSYLYFVAWDDRPNVAVAIGGHRVVSYVEWLHALLVHDPRLRETSASVVEAMLVELATLDDDAELPDWLDEVDEARGLTVLELRDRLRSSLAEISESDR